MYQLNENVKECTTNDVNENDFEAHVKYIDIHYLIIGKERISCVPLEKVELKIPYSSDNDIAFYKYANDDICNCIVGCGYFLSAGCSYAIVVCRSSWTKKESNNKD